MKHIKYAPLLIAISFSCGAGEIFKCVGDDGKVTFTSLSCDESKSRETVEIKRELTYAEKLRKEREERNARYEERWSRQREQWQEEKKSISEAHSKTHLYMSLASFRSTWNGVLPFKENTTTSTHGVRVQVVLDDPEKKKYYYFRDGVLTSISD